MIPCDLFEHVDSLNVVISRDIWLLYIGPVPEQSPFNTHE